MNTIAPQAALALLKLAEQDISTLRVAKQAAQRRKKLDFASIPDRQEEIRQAGIDEGLRLALQVINKRLHHQSAAQNDELSQKFLDARLRLQSAEVAYALADHGASAPLTSAAYSAYVQAYKVLEQARAAYVLVSREEGLAARQVAP